MAPIAGRRHCSRRGRDGAIAQLGERVVRNDEDGGSIPPGSTSLRWLRQLRLGKPHRSLGAKPAKAAPWEPPWAKTRHPQMYILHLRQLRLGKPHRSLGAKPAKAAAS